MITLSFPCGYVYLQRDLFAGLASVCLLPLAWSCLFCRFADGSMPAFLRVHFVYSGLVMKMAPSSRGVAWLRVGWTTLCQELRDGFSAGRSGRLFKRSFPKLVIVVIFHALFFGCKRAVFFFFPTLCVFVRARCKQRRGLLPPRRVCQELPPFLSDVEDASRALLSGVREAHTRAGMHFIMALPVLCPLFHSP